ncbi:MAG: hypothetical protein PVH88_05090 [Ignavibacteria bacterium]|jgi:hypothetical protein
MNLNATGYVKFFTVLFLLICISINTPAQNIDVYGYFSTRLEKVWSEPSLSGSNIVEEDSPYEWSYPFLNIMMQSKQDDQFRMFINLNGSDAENISVKNFWGEFSASQSFKIRLGKIYRKFGLYNEILDAVPTYYGIEPPELFDGDHLMISRTTMLMVLGSFNTESGVINYSLSTDNGEGGPSKENFPIGFDLNYSFDYGNYKIGVSGYLSGGDAVPDIDLGEGSPKSGVIPWMEKDNFSVIGGYFEGYLGNLLIQTEYYTAAHEAVRDPGKVVEMLNNANVLPAQISKYTTDPDNINESNIITNIDYDVQTWYLRAGYSFDANIGEIGPYIQWDWYSNPETIKEKSYGGDNEAGASDDGKFTKTTLGILYRPVPNVAVKLDQSFHFYKLNGEDVNYPEIRFDVSYTFGL